MNKKQNKGITLVALVITIIVLIILAGVSINAIMNEGLIGNAKDATSGYQNAKENEQTQLSTLLAELEHYDLPEVIAGGYTGTSNAKYKDANGQVAIIPAGFTVSNIKTDTVDETRISGGLVIYSKEVTDWSTAQTAHNQYVWIPVDNPSDIYGTLDSTVEGIEGTKFGKLYFKNTIDASTKYNWPVDGNVAYSKTSRREPAVLSSYDTDAQYYKTILGYNSVDEYKAGMVKEFNDMITSVEKYKGFYIGRYELTGANYNSPTVLKNANPIVQTNWYNFYKACTNLESGNTDAKDKVKTTMIWGCQWDQAVKKCLVFDDKFLTDNSAKYGVYSGNGTSGVQVSGTKDAAYNIYDMGGNVLDWTLEANNTGYRTCRGGYYDYSSANYPASIRGIYGDPNFSSSGNYGCRSQLYIK